MFVSLAKTINPGVFDFDKAIFPTNAMVDITCKALSGIRMGMSKTLHLTTSSPFTITASVIPF